jgi:hypothetical protein
MGPILLKMRTFPRLARAKRPFGFEVLPERRLRTGCIRTPRMPTFKRGLPLEPGFAPECGLTYERRPSLALRAERLLTEAFSPTLGSKGSITELFPVTFGAKGPVPKGFSWAFGTERLFFKRTSLAVAAKGLLLFGVELTRLAFKWLVTVLGF